MRAYRKDLDISKIVSKYSKCLYSKHRFGLCEKHRKNKIKKYEMKLQMFIEQEEATVQELEEALELDLYQNSEEAYKDILNELELREDMLIQNVKTIIAEYLGNPQLAVTLLGNKGN